MQQRPFRERARPYGVWFAFIVAAQAATYAIGAEVFATTVGCLGLLTAIVALCGLLSCAFAKRPRPWAVAGWSLASVAVIVAGGWFAILATWRC